MAQDPPRSKKKSKAKRKPRPNLEMEKAEKVYRVLYDLYHSVMGKKKGGELDSEEPATLSLSFSPDEKADDFARNLIDAIKAARCEGQNIPSFVEGRIYCYHCESPQCAHSEPPDPRSVFTGYTPTGFPVWNEFSTVVLEQETGRIDDLMEESPGVVAICREREELKTEQLQVFGRESALYDIWGQLNVGYLPFPRGGSQGRCALTIQVVRCLSHGRVELRLNVIGRVAKGEDLCAYLKRSSETELNGLFSAARGRLEALALKARARGRGKNQRLMPHAALPVLRRLGRGMERTFRRRQRRTRHASERRSERPAVGMALKDLAKVQSERFLHDEHHHTFIVLGPKWRSHVFGMDGKHITTMVLSKEGMQKRLDTRRWRFGTLEEMQVLQERVAALIGGKD